MRGRAYLRTALCALVVWALAASSAGAAVSSVLAGHTISGTAIPCTTQADGVRVCHGSDETNPGLALPSTTDERYKSVIEGTTQPLEIYVILPPAPTSGTDGNYPLVVQSHGWGSSAGGPNNTEFYGPTGDKLAKEGFAVLQLTARGFGDSCGKLSPQTGISYDATACGTTGYIRLDDDRYEVRDVQNAVGDLVDESLVDPGKIGVTGESYGGGVSLQLATLKDRVMNPDGTLSPWRSPGGTALSIAAAAPVIPWSDLAYSLVPNGHTVDSAVVGPKDDGSPIGIPKQSFVAGLYGLGQASGNYAPPQSNPQADLTSWFGEINSPSYESDPNIPSILDQIQHYHSAYYLLDGKYGYPAEAPPPLLIANGFTDDLFPVDEALRYVNLEHSLFPSAPTYMFDWDGGHSRGQNKKADNALLAAYINSFLQLYLQGSAGSSPGWGSTSTPPANTALTQTCPSTAASGGPFTGDSWAALHPGQVTYTTTTAQTVSSTAGDPTVAKTFDPIVAEESNTYACGTAPATDQGSGVATYRLAPATGGGYTLLGSPLVGVDLKGTSSSSELAVRLLDVDPKANTETLVARQLYRPSADGYQTFELHPGAWHFAAGHIAKLELLGQDTPYGKAPDGSFTITVSSLALALPVHETPGTTVTSGGGSTGGGGSSGGGGTGSSGGGGTTTTVVTKPTKTLPRPTSTGCRQVPSVRVTTRSGNRHGLVVRGRAAESACAHPSSAQRRNGRITQVTVFVFRNIGHARCRFVTARGTLGAARRCSAPIGLRARGTTSWQLRLHLRRSLPAGRYRLTVFATDGYRHRAAARTLIRL